MSALIQSVTNTATSGSSITATFPSNVTAGSTLVLCSLAPSGATVSDSQGNAWTQIPTGNIWYALNAKAGATTITINWGSSPGWMTAIASEFSAASAGGGYDTSSYAGGTSATPTGGTITPAVANELVVAYCSNGQVDTAGTGYTLIDNSTGDAVEYAVQSGSGSFAATFTQSASAAWYIHTVAFKPQGGATHTQTLSESFTISEAFAKKPAKSLAESYTVTDRGLKRTTGKKLSEAFTLAEIFAAVKTKVLALAEAFTLSDSIARATGKSLSDTLPLAELFAAVKTKLLVLTDSLTLTEAFSKAPSKALQETFALGESFAKAAARTFTETYTLAESLAKNTARRFTELFTPSESLGRAMSKHVNDTLTPADELSRNIGRTFIDTGLTLADGLARDVAKTFVESLTISEAVARLTSKAFAESFSLLESFVGQRIGAPAIRRYFAELLRRLFSAEPLARSFPATGEYMIYADPKDAEATEDFLIDWSGVVADDQITASVWEIADGDAIVLTGQTFTATSATGEFSGGTAGASYVVKNKVTLASGQIKVQSLLIPVV
jgi:hypothetical protein